MSTLGPFLISILLTTLSAMAFPLAILPFFAEVKPVEKKQLSSREMKLAIALLGLYILGFLNLYAIWNIGNKPSGEPDGGNPIVDSQGSDGEDSQDGSEQEAGGTGHSISPEEDLSPEELLVKQNWDEIQRLKAQYSETDTEVFENEDESLIFYIYEKAVLVFQDPAKAEVCDILSGKEVSNVKLVILDYSTDQILRTFYSGSDSYCRYSPGNEKIFYAVLFHDDYHIYVTRPFKVTRGNTPYGTAIYLEKKGAQYTPMFQLRLHVKDLHTDEDYSVVSSRNNAAISVVKNDGIEYDRRYGGTTESGILTWMEGTYFSLNTDYKLDLYLQQTSEAGSIDSTHQTFDGSVTNSNQIDLFFEFNQEDSGT